MKAIDAMNGRSSSDTECGEISMPITGIRRSHRYASSCWAVLKEVKLLSMPLSLMFVSHSDGNHHVMFKRCDCGLCVD